MSDRDDLLARLPEITVNDWNSLEEWAEDADAAIRADAETIKEARAQSTEDHAAMLAALGESMRLRDELYAAQVQVKAGYKLAAKLVGLPTDDADKVQRNLICDAVYEWRRALDTAPNEPK